MNLNAMLARASNWWKELDSQIKRRNLMIVVVSGLVLSGLLYIAFRPQYTTVFSGLTLSDSAEITSVLGAGGISSRLEGAGSAIAVPKRDADRARLAAASAGLPKTGSVGYDMINQGSLTMTESERTLQQQLLLEQQLTLTLQKISGVREAAVKLVVPKTEIFLDPNRQTVPTASVWVKAEGLDSSQVAGIVHLVARAVPNLEPDNVTVVNQEGRVLTADGIGANSGSSDQQAMQQTLQTELERSIGTLLGQVFGEDNVAVRVKAELDFDQRSSETVRWSAPDGGEEGLISHLEDMSEYYTSQGGGAAGQPGTGSNGGSYQTGEDSETSTLSENRQRVIDYELDQIREQIIYAPGAIKRLSVSVIVNTPDLGAETDKVQAAVQAAIGYDATRFDLVSIQALSFVESEPSTGDVDVPQSWYASLPVQIGLGALLAVVIMLALRVRGKKARMVMEELQPAPVAVTATEALAQAEKALELELPVPQDTEAQLMRKTLQQMAKDKPDEFALLIRAWLNEEG